MVAARRALSLLFALTLPLVWVEQVAAAGVYVANTGDNTVSVIEPKTLAVTKVIAVGEQPGVSAMAANPAGTRVYVPNRLSNSVSVIDTATDTVIATVAGEDAHGVPFFLFPTAVAVSPDGAEAWVAGLGSVTIIETAGNTVVGTIPHVCFDQPVASPDEGLPQAIAFHPSLSRAYVLSPDTSVGPADSHGSRLCVVDSETRTVVSSLTLPVTDPQDVVVRPDGAFLYVGGDAMQKIDAVTLAATPCCGTATRMAFGSRRSLPHGAPPFVLYATAFDNELHTIDPIVDLVYAATVFPGADEVHGVAVAGDRAFVTATGNDTVRVVNLFGSSFNPEATGPIAVGQLPRAIVAAVPPGADVGVTISAPETAGVGADVTYTIVVTNHGPVDATGVTLSDPLPTAATLVSRTTTRGTCTGTLSVSCTLGSLRAGASATVTLVVRFTTTGLHLNTVTIDSGRGDVFAGNDTAFARTSVTAGALEFAAATFSAGRGSGSAAISVRRVDSSVGTVIVSYATADGTGIAGQDYVPQSGQLTFMPGVTTRTFRVPFVATTALRGERTVKLTLESPTNGAGLGAQSTAVLTIVDNRQPGVFRLGSPRYSVREGGFVDVDIIRRPAPGNSGPLGANVSVSYATGSGNASAGSDFTHVEGTAVFGALETRKTVRIQTLQDASVEGREVFFFTLSSPGGGATLGSPSSASIVIEDDDAGGVVALGQKAYKVLEGAGSVSITVVRSGGRGANVSVDLATVPGTATAGTDYGAVFTTLTFAEGELAKTVVVPISPDDVAERDETFMVVLRNPRGGLRLGNPASAPVTIVEDDVVIEFSGKFKNNQPEVVRTGSLRATVSVQYFAESGTAMLGTDFTLKPGTLVFPAGVSSRFIPIKVINDNIAEGPETFRVTLLNPSPPARLGPDSVHEFTLNDDDFGGTVSFASARATATLGQRTPITIVRAGGVGTEMTVGWAAIGGSATSPTDFSPASGQVRFLGNESARTFVIDIGTAASTAGKTIVLGLTIPGGGAAKPGATNVSTLTILVPPLVRFEAPIYEVTEADGHAVLTLVREGDLAPAVTVQYRTEDRTARAGADYTATAGTATFASGQTTARLTVPILGDTDIESTEDVSVVLSNPTGGAVLTTPSTTVIRIADVPPPKATAAFSELTAPTIAYGTVATRLGGTLAAGAVVPTGVVRISLDGHTEEAVVGADGTFSATFETGTLTVPRSPYTITYEYGGDTRVGAVSDSTRALRVTRAAQTITFGVLSGKIFGDDDFTVSASAGSGLPVAFSAAGNCVLVSAQMLHITGAGACTVTARQPGDENHEPAVEVARSFPIARAAAMLRLGLAVFVHDGTPKPVEVTVEPSGLSGVSVTYDGSTVVPSEPGRYAVVASLTHDDYQAAPAIGTLVIVLADAGPDRAVDEGDAVTLDGSSSFAASYEWTQIAGGVSVTLAGADTRTATFTAPALPGGLGSTVLTFRLAAGDGTVTTSDTVNVTVKNVNHPPIPEPGDSTSVNEGSLVTLNGSRSYDPDGDPLVAYEWRQTSGFPVILVGANTATATFVAPFLPGGVSAGETFTFTLTVSDGELSSTSAELAITVEQLDHAPTAAAGDPQTVPVNSRVTLHGSGADPDGDAIAFVWRQTAGTEVTLSNSQAAAPAFTAPATPGRLVFELITSDGRLTSEPSSVMVSVVGAGPACDSARASPSTLWPPNHALVPIDIVGVAGADGDPVTLTVTGVTQDEPTNGLGDGDTPVDAVLVRDRLLLRAERAGRGDGRVYRVTFRADTAGGQSCTGSVTVGVPRDGKSTPIDSGQAYESL